MQKVELIDGDVVRSPAPTLQHQEILRRLLLEIGSWARGSMVLVGQSPCDVRFGPERILQPDAFVILERIPHGLQGPITRVPELCIEVLSRDIAYDRVTKRLLYAEAGVKELWLVSPAGSIERRTGLHLAEAEIVTDALGTPLLEGFQLDVAELFAPA